MEPPGLPFTDQLTAVFVVPDTAELNGKESPARTFAVGGDTTTLIADGGERGGGLVPRVVAAQPAVDRASKTLPTWSTLRILQGTNCEALNAAPSLRDGSAWGYWTKGQEWANVLDRRSGNHRVGVRRMLQREVRAGRSREAPFLRFCSLVRISSRQVYRFERCPNKGRINPHLGEARWFNSKDFFAVRTSEGLGFSNSFFLVARFGLREH